MWCMIVSLVKSSLFLISSVYFKVIVSNYKKISKYYSCPEKFTYGDMVCGFNKKMIIFHQKAIKIQMWMLLQK